MKRALSSLPVGRDNGFPKMEFAEFSRCDGFSNLALNEHAGVVAGVATLPQDGVTEGGFEISMPSSDSPFSSSLFRTPGVLRLT
mmetsp:Transcript_52917/g.107910  ORF Transcript_52917/g.107910 Transcript_52917/m.107910 type:complete len:84 (-) Transcript_52917:119-370(-)